MNPRELSYQADSRSRINPEIWIRIPHHFWYTGNQSSGALAVGGAMPLSEWSPVTKVYLGAYIISMATQSHIPSFMSIAFDSARKVPGNVAGAAVLHLHVACSPLWRRRNYAVIRVKVHIIGSSHDRKATFSTPTTKGATTGEIGGGGPDPQLFGGPPPNFWHNVFVGGSTVKPAEWIRCIIQKKKERRNSSCYYCRYYPLFIARQHTDARY